MKKLIFFIQILLVLFFVSTVKAADPSYTNTYCRFYPEGQAGAIAGDVSISSNCVIYGDQDGVVDGDLNILPGAKVTLYRTLVFSPGYDVNIQTGGIVYIMTGGMMKEGEICIKDADNDGYADTKILDKDPYGELLQNPITQIDQQVITSGICPVDYRFRSSMNNLTIVDNDPNTVDVTKLSTSDREMLRLGFVLNGITDAEAAVGDIQIIDKNMLVCTGGACPATNYAAPTTGNIYVAGKVGIGITNPGFLLDVNGTAEMNTLSIGGTAVTATSAELNILNGVTGLTAAELTNLGGVTATSAELNILDGVTGLTAAELTSLGAVTASSTELNYVDGVTSAIQTQLGLKAPLASPTFTGTVTAPTFSGALSGNASTATTATNQSGGTVSATTGTFSSYISTAANVYIRNVSPTVYFQDTDHRSAMLHNNSNLFYILRGAAVDSQSWAQYNGVWPFTVNLENNTITTGGSVTATSDIRLKTNIKPLPENIMDKVKQLEGVYFNWKTEADMGDARQIGVTAQDVEKIFPELVKDNADGYKSVSYDRLGPILIEAVKEQQVEIDSLKQQVTDLNQRLIKIESKLK